MSKEIQKYFNKKKETHNALIAFLEKSENIQFKFQNLIDLKKEEFEKFLHLLNSIFEHHHRTVELLKK